MPDPVLAAPPDPALGAAPAYEVVRDPLYPQQPVVFSGAFERGRFHPLGAAALVFVAAFLVYQLVGALVAAGLIVAEVAGEGAPDPAAILASMADHPGPLLLGNALGQLVGFGLLVWAAARLHTPDRAAFFRLRRPDGAGVGLAVAGLALGTPFLQWLARVNAQLPVPEWLRQMEEGRSALIEQALLHADLSLAFVLMTMAVTPALFEELLFRGYLHRQVERRLGPAGAVVLVGLFFGAFHLSALQVVPLAVLGVYLGACVWATGSLWTGVAVHLANNGLAVLVGDYVRDRPDLDLSALEAVPIPWYLAFLSAGLLAACAYALVMRRKARLAPSPF